MTIYRTIPCVLVAVLCLSGCAAYVGGDLRNTRSDYRMSACGDNPGAEYQVIYKSNAKDGGGPNIAIFLTCYSFGIIPTYWTTTARSEATILQNGTPILTRKYKSRIHEFYGILWAFVLPSKSINALRVDEDVGIGIKEGIEDRTLYKIISENGADDRFYQYCLMKEDNP